MIQSGKKISASYYDPEHETMSRDRLAGLQLQRLQATVKRVYQSVPFYRNAFKARG